MIGTVTAGSAAVHVAGFVALLLVGLTGSWAASVVTIAHEGGHVVTALLSGRNPSGFVGAGVGWVAVAGSEDLLALLAVTLVWWMLIGGLRSLVGMGLGEPGSDAAQLARCFLVPAVVWVALFWFVGTVCLWVGARRLLGF